MRTRTRRSQAERSTETTERLLASARRLFAERGYAGTSLADIVADTGMTKGAVYHHFSGKEDVFREVFEREQRALMRAVADAALRENDPWAGFHAGWSAFLEASQEPAVQRITLLEAPAALGWQATRKIASSYTLAMLATGLERAMAAGRIVAQPVQPLARLIYAAMCEGSTLVAHAPDGPAAAREVAAAVDALLAGLEVRAPASVDGRATRGHIPASGT
jgi:AcrR family transcriptional regulator